MNDTVTPRTLGRDYTARFLSLMLGLMLYALGVYFSVKANVGLAPWDAFAMGVHLQTGMSFGTASVVIGVAILGLIGLLREKIGIGTLLNTVLIGVFVDIYDWIGLLPQMQSLLTGIPVLLIGQFLICCGSYFYIRTALGCGPRDSLMVAMGKRLSRFPIGLVRGGVEGVALLLGWLMGAKVGLGTIIAVFGIGFILQFTMRMFRFDIKGVQHESIFATVRRVRDVLAPSAPAQPEGEQDPQQIK